MYHIKGAAFLSTWRWLYHPSCSPVAVTSPQPAKGMTLAFAEAKESHLSHSLGLVKGNAHKPHILHKEICSRALCSLSLREITAAWDWEGKGHPGLLCHCPCSQ